MPLIYADPSLRKEVGAHASFFQYLMPELRHFGVGPLVLTHRDAAPAFLNTITQPSALAWPLFRYSATDFNEDGKFEQVWKATWEDLHQTKGIKRSDLVYLNFAGIAQLMAAVRWFADLSEDICPKLLVQLAPINNRDGVAFAQFASPISKLLHTCAHGQLKIVSADKQTSENAQNWLQYPVNLWPHPQCSIVKVNKELAKGRAATVAILGGQSKEKGYDYVPELVASLLSRHDGQLICLVHNNDPGRTPSQQESLRSLAKQHKHLVLSEGPVNADTWRSFLEMTDIVVFPDDTTNRPSALLNELLANGIPSIVPDNTSLSDQLAQFGCSGQTFRSARLDSMVEVIDKAVVQYDSFALQTKRAKELWSQSHGNRKLVIEALTWHQKGDVRKTSAAYVKGSAPRVLMSWYCDPSYIPPPELSPNQVTVGPHPFATVGYLDPNARRAYDAYTPFKNLYDLEETVRMQGISGSFDLVVVFTESSVNNVPINVKSFGCPTVLYLGDTHHSPLPIHNMTQYATKVGFDYVVSTYNRQHTHWLTECGVNQVAWIPAVSAQHLPQNSSSELKHRLAVVGQTGPLHARRTRLIEALRKAGFVIQPQAMSRAQAAAFYHSSTLSFNASLNGDLNLRTFEVMSAGGCLLTDRLTPESGQSLLFEEGQEFLAYSSAEELIDKIQIYLSDTESTQRIAQSGHRKYMERFLPEKQQSAFTDWVLRGVLPSEYECKWDPRPRLAALDQVPVANRISIYEEAQELHRKQEQVQVLLSPTAPLCIAADLIDLPRLHCSVLSPDDSRRSILESHGLAGRVQFLHSVEEAASQSWDLLFTTVEDSTVLRRAPHSKAFEFGRVRNRAA